MSNTIHFRCQGMTEADAISIEELGDDLSPEDGFLRREENGEFAIYLNVARLGPYSSDYTQAFHRFAETYLSYLQDEDSTCTNKLRSFFPDETDHECLEIEDFSRRELPPLKLVTVNGYLLVLDYRKHLFGSPKPEKRLRLLAKWLKEQNADVILIQEVIGEKGYNLIKKSVLGEELMKQEKGTGEKFAVYVGAFSDLVVLSRHPITESSFLKTRWQGSEHERCMLLKTADYRHGFHSFKINFHGQEVFIVHAHPIPRHAHFKNAREPADVYTPERLENLLEAWAVYDKEFRCQPAIFAGDLNFSPDNEEYLFFDQLFGLQNVVFETMQKGNYEGALSTYTPDNDWVDEPDWGILDHIFVNHWITPLRASIVDPDPDFSDHFPVVASLQIENLIPECIASPTAPPVSLAKIRELKKYFDGVDLDWLCDSAIFTDDIKNQISATLVFLQNLEEQVSLPP